MKDSKSYPKIPENHRFEWIPAQSDKESFDHLHPVLNNTKWDELRLSMHALDFAVSFRSKILGTHWITDWDIDWDYHFRWGGYITKAPADRFVFVHRPEDKYKYIEWVELHFQSQDRLLILSTLANLAIPYELSEAGLKVFGYIDDTGRLTVP